MSVNFWGQYKSQQMMRRITCLSDAIYQKIHMELKQKKNTFKFVYRHTKSFPPKSIILIIIWKLQKNIPIVNPYLEFGNHLLDDVLIPIFWKYGIIKNYIFCLSKSLNFIQYFFIWLNFRVPHFSVLNRNLSITLNESNYSAAWTDDCLQ